MQHGPCCDLKGAQIAIGYVRVLLGDHGPYIELTQEQVRAQPPKHVDRYDNVTMHH